MKVTTKSEHSWAFYTPLAYFVFFFLQPILDHAGWKEWLLTGLGTIVFLVLYLGVLWVERKPWPLVGIGVMILVIVGVEWWVWHLSGWFLFYAGGLSVVVGGTNIYFAQRTRMFCQLQAANAEIEHLAKVAERERIARDLHDVLGHTLSVIILKSELAGKLID